jgi:hypothetical protein
LTNVLVVSLAEQPRVPVDVGAAYARQLTTQGIATALFHAWRERPPFDGVERLPSAVAVTDDQQVLETFEFCREHSVLTFYGDRDRLKSTWSKTAGEDISTLNR